MTTMAYILIFGLLATLSASAVWGLWWAMKGGQFTQFERGSLSIFDPDEPVGRPTDRFPPQEQA